ncbi:MAG: hypothetical protein CSA97_02975 [Bacteroidetes bacterium]|nr:MAG: hypothetical protein CSA97_02975 [Bacteroidota bacterium]
MATSPDFERLAAQYGPRLERLQRLHRIVAVVGTIMYALTFIWLIATLTSALWISHLSPEMQASYGSMGIFILVPVALLSFAFTRALTRLASMEKSVREELFRSLFPNMLFSEREVSDRDLSDSQLFGRRSFGEDSYAATFGRLERMSEGVELQVYDVGVGTSRVEGWRNNPALQYAKLLYNATIRPIFSARRDAGSLDFRGMFGCYHIDRMKYAAQLLILPDHLEGRVGYFAQILQSFRKRHGASLVRLEDPDFERYFAVYADDEVAARRILTPAMMRRMTQLRKDFGRDIMFSFTRWDFYYAAPMPEGFLSIRPSRASSADQLRAIHRDVQTALGLVDVLKVK